MDDSLHADPFLPSALLQLMWHSRIVLTSARQSPLEPIATVADGSPAAKLTPAPRIALLACSVLNQEIAGLTAGAEHIVETRFLEMGLHDRPDHLRGALQDHICSVDARPDIEAIVLVYGLCGCGTAGLRALHHRLVIPRAHDCITLLLGSKEAHAERQRCRPACYYYSPGWNRDRRVPGPERLEHLRAVLSKRFTPDSIDDLLEAERELWTGYDTVAFVDQGTKDADAGINYSQHCADWLGWKYEHVLGNPALLRDLLWCNWTDDRFQIIEPGMRLGQAFDNTIVRAEPDTNPVIKA
jgi:hypothetical protein